MVVLPSWPVPIPVSIPRRVLRGFRDLDVRKTINTLEAAGLDPVSIPRRVLRGFRGESEAVDATKSWCPSSFNTPEGVEGFSRSRLSPTCSRVSMTMTLTFQYPGGC